MSQKHHLQLHREALQRRTNQGKKSLEFNNGIQTGTNFTTILQIGQIENTYNCKSYLLIIYLWYSRIELQLKVSHFYIFLSYRMSSSITRIADFLNAFSKSCSGRLSYLDARLTSLERKVTFLEAKVGVSEDTFSSEKILNKNGLNDNDAQRRVSDESEDESYLESQRFPAWSNVPP